jgi:hypothetical protein
MWEGPTAVPGTSDAIEPFFATAPDGTDAVAWFVQEGPDDIEIRARIRPPGAVGWQGVPVRVDGRPSVQDLDLAPSPDGDFWLTWVQYRTHPAVYAMRLDSSAQRWTRPFQVFDAPKYGHLGPQVSVAGNGTVLIAANAKLKEFSSPPVFRVAVATRQGGSWSRRYLTPAGEFAVNPAVATNGQGQLLVGFIDGYATEDKSVSAAVRQPGQAADWDVQAVSAVGDGQTFAVDLGETGRAAITWPAPSMSADGVRLATSSVRTASWTTRTLTTGVTLVDNPQTAVTNDGSVLTAWSEDVAGDVVIQSKFLEGGVLYPQVQLSTTDVTARPATLVALADGDVNLLYEELTPGTSITQGLRLVRVDGAFPGAPGTLTLNDDGTPQFESLGVTAASRSVVLWRRGSLPTPDFATLDQTLVRPGVFTGPETGRTVTRARVTGVLRVDSTATCDTGYWVEAGPRSYRWFRDGDPIRRADGRSYRIQRADKDARLSCRASATNDSGLSRVLEAPTRTVR